VLENGMPRFFRRFAEGVFDEEDVVRRANELADFVSSAAEKYSFLQSDVTAVGYSNGANIAAAMMLLRPESVGGAILLRAMVPLQSPPESDLSGKRVFISAGAADPIIPQENAERLFALLKERGASAVELLVQSAGHGLVSQEIAAAARWLTTR
jgi:phospholipase/carboxylesterase